MDTFRRSSILLNIEEIMVTCEYCDALVEHSHLCSKIQRLVRERDHAAKEGDLILLQVEEARVFRVSVCSALACHWSQPLNAIEEQRHTIARLRESLRTEISEKEAIELQNRAFKNALEKILDIRVQDKQITDAWREARQIAFDAFGVAPFADFGLTENPNHQKDGA
jgi:hypothetical protein